MGLAQSSNPNPTEPNESDDVQHFDPVTTSTPRNRQEGTPSNQDDETNSSIATNDLANQVEQNENDASLPLDYDAVVDRLWAKQFRDKRLEEERLEAERMDQIGTDWSSDDSVPNQDGPPTAFRPFSTGFRRRALPSSNSTTKTSQDIKNIKENMVGKEEIKDMIQDGLANAVTPADLKSAISESNDYNASERGKIDKKQHSQRFATLKHQKSSSKKINQNTKNIGKNGVTASCALTAARGAQGTADDAQHTATDAKQSAESNTTVIAGLVEMVGNNRRWIYAIIFSLFAMFINYSIERLCN